MSLSDDGQGFDPGMSEQEGIGLRSIHERMAQIGGTIRIQSTTGMGMALVARCPLSQEQALQHASEVTG